MSEPPDPPGRDAEVLDELTSTLVESFRSIVGLVLARYPQLGRAGAEDVASRSILRSIEIRLDFSSDRGSPQAWLHGIARIEALAVLRESGREVSAGEVDDHLVDTPSGASSTVLDENQREILRDAIASLAPADSAMIHLRIYGDLSFDQIAQILDSKPGAVRTRYWRAMERLRGKLIPHERELLQDRAPRERGCGDGPAS